MPDSGLPASLARGERRGAGKVWVMPDRDHPVRLRAARFVRFAKPQKRASFGASLFAFGATARCS